MNEFEEVYWFLQNFLCGMRPFEVYFYKSNQGIYCSNISFPSFINLQTRSIVFILNSNYHQGTRVSTGNTFSAFPVRHSPSTFDWLSRPANFQNRSATRFFALFLKLRAILTYDRHSFQNLQAYAYALPAHKTYTDSHIGRCAKSTWMFIRQTRHKHNTASLTS